MTRRRKVLSIALCVLLVVLISYWLLLKWQFAGDGTIRYLGPFAPSYRISMSAVPLNKPGEYRYSFRRLPAIPEMDVLLEVNGERKDLHELEKLNTAIEVRFIDSAGKNVCKASGTLGPPAKHQWVVMSDGYAIIYSVDCLHLSIQSRRTYTLLIRIQDVDPHSPVVLLTPMLEWGGIKIELP
jgi:hypothetical protein